MFSRKQSATLSGIAFLILGAIIFFSLPISKWTVLLLWGPGLLGVLLPEMIGSNIRFLIAYGAIGFAWGALRRLPARPAAFLISIAIRFGLFSVLPGAAFLLIAYITDI
ncbi:hypothetical protein [Metapseudomonas otitidis]|uniref:hypothetical protein n=1 Tax=Metapseudomonas otitidis TaxID=319939 RepID=UPI0013F5C43A|nr:hypothetical protein [Pseudomonas otitidis]